MNGIVLMVLLAAASGSAAQDPRVEAWRQDVRFLASEIERRHPDPFFKTGREEFQKKVRDLETALPKLQDPEIKVALVRLVSSLGDVQTRLRWTADQNYPMALSHFRDGIFVVRAPENAPRLLGARLAAIAETPVDQVRKAVAPLTACEDEACLKDALPRYLTSVEVLRSLRIVPDGDEAQFTFQDGEGRFTMGLRPIGPREMNLGAWKVAYADEPGGGPLYRRNRERNFWESYLADSDTLYVQVSRRESSRAQSFGEFSAQVFRQAEASPVKRLVLDLRRAIAGVDEGMLKPLLDGLESRPRLRERGKLFVVTGRTTFPDAAAAARAIQKRFQAIVVGEIPSRRSIFADEVSVIELPKSGLQLAVSKRKETPAAVRSEVPVPDLPAEASFEEYRSGRDPALEAILAYR